METALIIVAVVVVVLVIAALLWRRERSRWLRRASAPSTTTRSTTPTANVGPSVSFASARSVGGNSTSDPRRGCTSSVHGAMGRHPAALR